MARRLMWYMAAIIAALLLACETNAWSHSDVAVIEQFEYVGESHFEFGKALGTRFRDKIQARVRQNTKLQTRLLPFVQTTEEGKQAYAAYLSTHEAHFPDYVNELRGIAEGAELPFETIFVINLTEEFDEAVPTSFTAGAGYAHKKTLHCSDVVLVSDTLRVVAHNEDGGVEDMNHTAIVIAQIGADKPKFVGFTYLGDLPTGAFGFNDRGVAFTLNLVQPASSEVGGLGRGFISRHVLEATSIEDAFRRIMAPRQGAGHNFQLMDVKLERIWNIETASWNRFASQEFIARPNGNVTTFLHANQYQLLAIEQIPYASSIHRLKRYSELPVPQTVDDALRVLGDQHDRLYPFYHDVLSHERGDLSGWTLTTIVFDLKQKQAVSYRGNPSKQVREFVWDLEKLTISPVSVTATA